MILSFLIFFIFLSGLLTAGIVYLLIKNKRETAHKQQLLTDFKQLESKINNIELDTLKHKFEPHLFKNILNSIQSHAYQTYFSLDKLSNVLDYILYESDKQFVTIKEEIQFALSLIEINKLKLSPLFDIKVKNKVDETHPFYEQVLLAPMVTVDLIENAFKHADIQSEDAFISITFELKDDYFSLTVANKISTKPSLKKTNGGVGKDTLKKRLDILYKDCHTLEQFVENDVFISHLKLNLLEYKAKMLIAG